MGAVEVYGSKTGSNNASRGNAVSEEYASDSIEKDRPLIVLDLN